MNEYVYPLGTKNTENTFGMNYSIKFAFYFRPFYASNDEANSNQDFDDDDFEQSSDVKFTL